MICPATCSDYNLQIDGWIMICPATCAEYVGRHHKTAKIAARKVPVRGRLSAVKLSVAGDWALAGEKLKKQKKQKSRNLLVPRFRVSVFSFFRFFVFSFIRSLVFSLSFFVLVFFHLHFFLPAQLAEGFAPNGLSAGQDVVTGVFPPSPDQVCATMDGNIRSV